MTDKEKPAGKRANQSAETSKNSEYSIDPSVSPMPIVEPLPEAPFPICALPDPLREVIVEVETYVQAPLGLIVNCIFSALSIATQSYYNARRDTTLCGPVSLNMLTIAESGERKSEVDRLVMEPIRRFDSQSRLDAREPMQKYYALHKRWEAEIAGIEVKIRRAAGGKSDLSGFEEALKKLYANEPPRPDVPKLLREDLTPEGLARVLSEDWPSAGIISSEAGAVLGGHGMNTDSASRFLSLLNKLWSGESFTRDRATQASLSLEDCRLTVGLQIQAAAMREFMERLGKLARGNGWFARFLICFPDSKVGYRPYSSPPSDWPALNRFHERLKCLIETPIQRDESRRLILNELIFDDDAFTAWVDEYNQIERESRLGGQFDDIRDVASKAAENVARLAALLHVFEGGDGPIPARLIVSAAEIVRWYLNEMKRFFHYMSLPSAARRVLDLEGYLKKVFRKTGAREVSRSQILKGGPDSTRKAESLNSALRAGAQLNRCGVVKHGNASFVTLHEALLEADLKPR